MLHFNGKDITTGIPFSDAVTAWLAYADEAEATLPTPVAGDSPPPPSPEPPHD